MLEALVRDGFREIVTGLAEHSGIA